jgi:hypothetical protein
LQDEFARRFENECEHRLSGFEEAM